MLQTTYNLKKKWRCPTECAPLSPRSALAAANRLRANGSFVQIARQNTMVLPHYFAQVSKCARQLVRPIITTQDFGILIFGAVLMPYKRITLLVILITLSKTWFKLGDRKMWMRLDETILLCSWVVTTQVFASNRKYGAVFETTGQLILGLLFCVWKIV